ncbi:hypothetical protein [Bacillus thuringiensis]|nr:hypothetical protein [Bacillus thuringiensis]AOB42101.1 hypothetical protein pFR260_004c [Bacillus thuringiensis]
MKKKFIITGVAGGILATTLAYGNFNLSDNQNTKVYAASENENITKKSIAVQNSDEEKKRIQTLMLNSIDNFKTAKGSFEYFSTNGNYHLLVEYQTDLSDNPKSYEKVRGIATANHKTLKKGAIEPGYEISTYDGESLNNFNSGSADFQTNSVTKDSKPNTYTVATPPITNEERTELKDSNINQRVIEKGGEKTYIHRLDPAYMRIAKTSLFPEDFAMGFLAD